MYEKFAARAGFGSNGNRVSIPPTRSAGRVSNQLRQPHGALTEGQRPIPGRRCPLAAHSQSVAETHLHRESVSMTGGFGGISRLFQEVRLLRPRVKVRG